MMRSLKHQPPKHQSPKWPPGNGLGIRLAGVALSGLLWLTTGCIPHQSNGFTAEQLGDWLGLELPEDINRIDSHRDRWLESQFLVRIHVPESSIAEFVERNGLVRLEGSLDQRLPQADQVEGLDWWQLEMALAESGNRWTAYEIPSLGDGVYAESGSTATGVYLPMIVVIPTEKDYVWLYLRGLDL